MAAGTTVARINTIVTANTSQFTAGMKQAEGRAAKFKTAIGGVARAASGPLTLGLLGAGAAAVKAATEFDDSMSKIESLVGVAGTEVEAMKESVLGLAGTTARAPAELADAMFFIQSAGLRGSAAMDTLEASAKAAAVGLGDTATIADLATSALNAYGEENLSATQATDVMVAAVREGKLEASELAGSMGRVLPIASAMGVRFDEVGAAFAALSRTGTNAAEAATQVRGIMSSLLRPTKQAEEALTDMGLSSEGLRTQLREEGLLATLQTLSDKFAGNEAAAASVFGNIRALSGVMDLMGENVGTTEAIFANMTDTTGTLATAFEVASDTAGFKFQQAMADLQTTLIEIGQQVLPIVLTMLEGAQSLVAAFTNMPEPLKIAAGAMAAFVIASGPIGQIALAVGGLLYVVGKMGEESKLAATRQEALAEEMDNAGESSSVMIDRMRDLAASINDVGDGSDELAGLVNDLAGSGIALEMALDNGTLPAFHRLDLSMDDVSKAAKNGTDAFQDMQDTWGDYGKDLDELRKDTQGLTGDELELANALLDALEAGEITNDEFLKMIDVVDETADAFDDQRAALEEDAEAFIKSADAAKLLNAANLDGEKLLGQWAEAGKSYTEQAELMNILTMDLSGVANDYSIEAQRAGVYTSDLADEMGNAEPAAADLQYGMSLVEQTIAATADSATTLQEAFSELMGTLVFEGEALNNTQMLMADFDQIIKDMATMSVPDLRNEFYTMAKDASAQLGELYDAGIELGSPEMIGAAEAFAEDLVKVGTAAGIPKNELIAITGLLDSIAGSVTTFTVRMQYEGLDTLVPQVGTGDLHFGDAPTGDLTAPLLPVGATGGIVTRPTLALIGEAGPEAVVPLNQAPGASPLGSGVGGGGDVNVTVNMPPGSDGADVVRALQAYARSHGGSVPILTGQL